MNRTERIEMYKEIAEKLRDSHFEPKDGLHTTDDAVIFITGIEQEEDRGRMSRSVVFNGMACGFAESLFNIAQREDTPNSVKKAILVASSYILSNSFQGDFQAQILSAAVFDYAEPDDMLCNCDKCKAKRAAKDINVN